jgi:hypothetical protein
MVYNCSKFVNYLIRQGCECDLIGSTSDRVLTMIHRGNETEAYIIRDRRDLIKWETIILICARLRVGLPGKADLT